MTIAPTIIFLYNYESKKLSGPYVAFSGPQLYDDDDSRQTDFEVDRYPCQIRVRGIFTRDIGGIARDIGGGGKVVDSADINKGPVASCDLTAQYVIWLMGANPQFFESNDAAYDGTSSPVHSPARSPVHSPAQSPEGQTSPGFQAVSSVMPKNDRVRGGDERRDELAALKIGGEDHMCWYFFSRCALPLTVV